MQSDITLTRPDLKRFERDVLTMTKYKSMQEDLALSLARSVHNLSAQDMRTIAESNPELVQEWLDEMRVVHRALQSQASLLQQEIDRLQSEQSATLPRVAA